MGKQQFPKILINDVSLLCQYPKPHVFQRQPLHSGTVLPFCLQRHQGALQICHRVPQLRRQPVSIAGGAGGRIRCAAGGQDDRLSGELSAVLQDHTGYIAVLGLDMGRPSVYR